MRITGGTYRSRPLRAPHGIATRPTSDRVREALFSILTARGVVRGARVLDLYAGTGALSLEALSRGATHATLVENGRDALSALRANIDSLNAHADTKVVPLTVERAANSLKGAPPFDLAFADPPYKDVEHAVPLALAAILGAGLIADGGLLVLEHAHRSPPPAISGVSLDESRSYGDTQLTFYRVATNDVAL